MKARTLVSSVRACSPSSPASVETRPAVCEFTSEPRRTSDSELVMSSADRDAS